MATLILRLVLGLILLTTGLGKLLDVPGLVAVLQTYGSLPVWAEYPTAVGLVLVELKLAECLLLNVHLWRAAQTALGLHLIFLLWATYHVVVGVSVPNCGCFGVFWARPLGWSTVVEDAVMCALCAWLVVLLGRKDK